MSFSTSSLFFLASVSFRSLGEIFSPTYDFLQSHFQTHFGLMLLFIPIDPRLVMKRNEETSGERDCLSGYVKAEGSRHLTNIQQYKSLWHLMVKTQQFGIKLPIDNTL